MIVKYWKSLVVLLLTLASLAFSQGTKFNKHQEFIGKSASYIEKKYPLVKKINDQTFMVTKTNNKIFFNLKNQRVNRVEVKGAHAKSKNIWAKDIILISNPRSGHLLNQFFFVAVPKEGLVYKANIKGQVLSISYKHPWIDKRKSERFSSLVKRLKGKTKRR